MYFLCDWASTAMTSRGINKQILAKRPDSSVPLFFLFFFFSFVTFHDPNHMWSFKAARAQIVVILTESNKAVVMLHVLN